MQRGKSIYYEAHVTIEPVFDSSLTQFVELCSFQGFRVAELLMKKRSTDKPERSKYDSFCTARSDSYDDIVERTLALVKSLEKSGYKVWRYKVEDTLLDSNFNDDIHPLYRTKQ